MQNMYIEKIPKRKPSVERQLSKTNREDRKDRRARRDGRNAKRYYEEGTGDGF